MTPSPTATETPSAESPNSPETAAEERAPAAPNGSAGPDAVREAVLDALHNVLDPELGINIVDLGLVYEVDVRGETVHIEYTLTTMGCPIGPLAGSKLGRCRVGGA